MKTLMNNIICIILIWGITLCSSCKDIFDSIRDYASEETIYPASFDTIAGKIGFERVEIDLSTSGRISTNQMKLAKAKKTVVECSFFEKPLIIDSVCSWINITGIDQPEEYTFKIYTEDEFGNRSIPKEIALVPYTARDLEQLELIPPRLTVSSSAAVLEWESSLSGVAFECLSYSYIYTDKDGNVRSGNAEGDKPSIIIENLSKDKVYPIEITLRIVPKKNDNPIIDTVSWSSIIEVRIPQSAGEAIFLKAPISPYTLDLNILNNNTMVPFSWTEVEGVDSYTLKISSSSTFDSGSTYEKILGKVSSVDLSVEEISQLVKNGSGKFYWTIVPSSGGNEIINQIRTLSIYRALRPSGLWDFDNPSDIFEAKIGTPLSEVSLVSSSPIQKTVGVTNTDGAIYVPERSYLTCVHGIQPKDGEERVNEYTLTMTLKVPTFKWYSIADIDELNNNGEFFISPNGEVGIDGFWNLSTRNMSVNTWHTITYSVILDKYFKIYIDGQLVKTINTDASYKNGRYALRPNLYLFRDDATWNNVNTSTVTEIIIWDKALNDFEVAEMRNIRFK